MNPPEWPIVGWGDEDLYAMDLWERAKERDHAETEEGQAQGTCGDRG